MHRPTLSTSSSSSSPTAPSTLSHIRDKALRAEGQTCKEISQFVRGHWQELLLCTAVLYGASLSPLTEPYIIDAFLISTIACVVYNGLKDHTSPPVAPTSQHPTTPGKNRTWTNPEPAPSPQVTETPKERIARLQPSEIDGFAKQLAQEVNALIAQLKPYVTNGEKLQHLEELEQASADLSQITSTKGKSSESKDRLILEKALRVKNEATTDYSSLLRATKTAEADAALKKRLKSSHHYIKILGNGSCLFAAFQLFEDISQGSNPSQLEQQSERNALKVDAREMRKKLAEQSQKMARDAATKYTGKTWKQHIQDELRALYQQTIVQQPGVPKCLNKKFLELAKTPGRIDTFIESEQEGKGWQAYIEAQKTASDFWGTHLEMAAFYLLTGIEVHQARLAEGRLKWVNPLEETLGIQYKGKGKKEKNRSAVRLASPLNHYDLVIPKSKEEKEAEPSSLGSGGSSSASFPEKTTLPSGLRRRKEPPVTDSSTPCLVS